MNNKIASSVSALIDFMSFAYTAEVVNVEAVSLEAYLEFTGQLMEELHAGKAKVVATCDWESQLPGKGKLCI